MNRLALAETTEGGAAETAKGGNTLSGFRGANLAQASIAMSCEDTSFLYHGVLLPKETHSPQSLKFAQEFTFKEDDVVAVTYPKSG